MRRTQMEVKKTLSSDALQLHGSVLLSRSPHAPSLTSRFSRAAQRSGDVGKLINIQQTVRGDERLEYDR